MMLKVVSTHGCDVWVNILHVEMIEVIAAKGKEKGHTLIRTFSREIRTFEPAAELAARFAEGVPE